MLVGAYLGSLCTTRPPVLYAPTQKSLIFFVPYQLKGIILYIYFVVKAYSKIFHSFISFAIFLLGHVFSAISVHLFIVDPHLLFVTHNKLV